MLVEKHSKICIITKLGKIKFLHKNQRDWPHSDRRLARINTGQLHSILLLKSITSVLPIVWRKKTFNSNFLILRGNVLLKIRGANYDIPRRVRVNDWAWVRDDIFLDQKRDVVVVFWARYFLSIRHWSLQLRKETSLCGILDNYCKFTPRKILELQPRTGREHQAQNTTTTSLCWSNKK